MVETLSILVWHISFRLFSVKKILVMDRFGERSRILNQSEGRGAVQFSWVGTPDPPAQFQFALVAYFKSKCAVIKIS